MTNVTPSSKSVPEPAARSGAVRWRSVPYVQPLRRSPRWRVEIMSASEGEHGGYKEISPKLAVMVYMVV